MRRARAGARRGARPMTAPLLETRGLSQNFGALAAARDIDFRLEAGRAPRADRPERRRQDHLRQPAHRRAAARRRARCCSRAATSRAWRRPSGSSSASPAPSRSTGCSAGSRCWRTSTSRSPSASGAAPSMFRPAGLRRDVVDESMHLLETAEARRRRASPHLGAALRPPAPGRARDRARPQARRCCCSTSPPPACRARRATSSSTPSTRCPGAHRRAHHRPRHGPGVPLRLAHHGAGERRRVRAAGPRARSAPIPTCAPSIWARRGVAPGPAREPVE